MNQKDYAAMLKDVGIIVEKLSVLKSMPASEVRQVMSVLNTYNTFVTRVTGNELLITDVTEQQPTDDVVTTGPDLEINSDEVPF